MKNNLAGTPVASTFTYTLFSEAGVWQILYHRELQTVEKEKAAA